MRILQTVVGTETFGMPSGTDVRLELLDQVLALAQAKGCRLVHLPAGYLTVAAADQVAAAVDQLTGRARRHGLALSGGVDLTAMRKHLGGGLQEALPRHGLPAFGFCDAPGRRGECFWRQLTSRAVHAAHVSELDVDARTTTVDDRRVLHLVCGEMHNGAFRRQLAAHAPGWDLVLVSGHAGLGQGLVPTLQAIARAAGAPVIHAQHTRRSGGLHMSLRSGRAASTHAGRNVIVSGVGEWIGWAVRNV